MRVAILAVVLIAIAGDCVSGFVVSKALGLVRPVTVHAESRTYCQGPGVFLPCAQVEDPDEVLDL